MAQPRAVVDQLAKLLDGQSKARLSCEERVASLEADLKIHKTMVKGLEMALASIGKALELAVADLLRDPNRDDIMAVAKDLSVLAEEIRKGLEHADNS